MSGKLDCFIYLPWLSAVGAGVEKKKHENNREAASAL